MLSQEVTERLARASANQAKYQPDPAIAAQIKEKGLIMFVGPAASGKSYLMNHISDSDKAFQRVSVFSTRDPREDDELGMFRFYPHDNDNLTILLDKIEARQVVQYAIHPTSGRIYGSEIEDYKGTFNMLATLSGVVGQLSQLPFSSTHVIGLAIQPDIWQKRFNARYPEASVERTKRLQEAIVSLEWLLEDDQPTITWADNTSTSSDITVQLVINNVKYSKPMNSSTRNIAFAMLEHIKKEP